MMRQAMARDFSWERSVATTSRSTAGPSPDSGDDARPTMDFVLTLHSHLPYVLNHGRWPHGSDWLCEAALDTYLPLIEELRALAAERVAAPPVTIGFTPVLANQLASPTFVSEMERLLRAAALACDEARSRSPRPARSICSRWWSSGATR